jgi:signal peptidase I
MNMKKDKVKIYVLEILLVIILFFVLFVSNMISRSKLAIILAVYMVITCVIIKKRCVYSTYKKQVAILMLAFASIYLSVFYIMGLYFGFYKSSLTFSHWTIMRYIIPTTVIIISSEIIRSIFLVQRGRVSQSIVFIAMVLIDIIVYAGIYDINTLEGLLAILGFVTFSSIACNLLYNYMSVRFGSKPIIIYRLITVLYAYILPIIPDVYMFFRTFLRIIYPYMIYFILEYLYNRHEPEVKIKKKKSVVLSLVLTITLLVSLIMLISCSFKYGMIVVGSGSMTGAINKGDAIVYESYDDQSIKEGQVIVFMKNDIKLVHRVVDVKNVNGELRYFTKGDVNETMDEGYITEDKILGIYKFKIKYIGYPTLWVRDIFEI